MLGSCSKWEGRNPILPSKTSVFASKPIVTLTALVLLTAASAHADTASNVSAEAGLSTLALCLLGWGVAIIALVCLWRKTSKCRVVEERADQFENSLNKVADLMVRYRPREGRFDFASSSIERITGFSAAEFLALRPRDVFLRILPEDQLSFLSALARAFSNEDVDGDACEFRWRAKDGSQIWARTAFRVGHAKDGDIDALLATTQVSTLQKRVEAHARARTQRIISSFPGAVFRLVMSPDGKYFLPYITDGGLRLFGMPAENLTNNLDALKALSPREDRIRLADAIRKSAETRKDLEAEIRITPPEAPTRWALVRSVPRKKADGRILWDGVLLDITELKKAEDEKTALQAQLYQSQKLEAMGRLAGGVAHDFNNLLTAILGYSDFLLKSLEPDSPRRKEAEQIRKAGEKASALTQQLLAFSRRQVVKPIILDLNEAISGLGKMLRRLIGEDIDLQLHLAGSPCWVKADPVQIDQIMMNLVVNARDAMPEGGRLTVETGAETFDGPAACDGFVMPPGEYAVVSVSDTGCGMDEETKRRVFDPFFTTKEVGKGTGLGMATVYGAVKQNTGYIVIFSEMGKGTTVKVYLPLADASLGIQTETPVAALQETYPGTEKILVVEDDNAVRAVAKRLLEENGYTVHEADCGQKALHICEQPDIPIDLVLTDTIMPGMNGPELAKRIRQLRPSLGIIFMSGYTDTVLAQGGLLDGDIVLIPKPFTAVRLTHDIRQALNKQRSPIPDSMPRS